MKSKKVNLQVWVNGATINYDDTGKGNMPLLFIHGFPFDKTMWKPQIDYFSKSFRVISYDIRGFGKSTADNNHISISLFADDLINFMNALNINKAVVCGLSMGGYILLNAINRYQGRFEAIILANTQCVADSEEAKVKRNKSVQLIEAGGLIDFTNAFVANIFCNETFNNNKEVVDRIKNVILNTSPEIITKTLIALAQRAEMCSSLEYIFVPALIISGREDKIIPVTQSEFLFENISESKMQSIENAGHMSNLEQPAEFNKYVNNFITGIIK